MRLVVGSGAACEQQEDEQRESRAHDQVEAITTALASQKATRPVQRGLQRARFAKKPR